MTQFRYWHEADIKLRPLFGRYGMESGHHRLVMSISAFDPNRTSHEVLNQTLLSAGRAGTGDWKKRTITLSLLLDGASVCYIPIEAKITANTPSRTITKKMALTTDTVVCRPSDSALPLTWKPSTHATMPITSAMNGALLIPTTK